MRVAMRSAWGRQARASEIWNVSLAKPITKIVRTMLERDLAEDFKQIFEAFPLHIPNNASVAGWPDRFIQLPNSKLVAVELKVVSLTLDSFYRLNRFRNSQAAWMAKWTKAGGLGFLFIAVMERDTCVGYHAIEHVDWRAWLDVNKKRYYSDSHLRLHSFDQVRTWFRDFTYERNERIALTETILMNNAMA